MPRMARVVVPGIPHHLTQRGNRREDVFFSDGDRQRYLQLLLEYSAKHGLETLAYCLMINHIHMVCVPAREKSLSSVLKPLDMRYAQHMNWTHGISGRLWQGRYYSCVLDEEHVWAAIRYVERNPVRARMVRRAEKYAWSSAAAHCGLRSDPVLLRLPNGRPAESADWSAWLAEKDDEKMLKTLRLHTRTGRPAADKRFIAALESKLGRRLQAKPVGRPKRVKNASI
jgi:putative transposase